MATDKDKLIEKIRKLIIDRKYEVRHIDRRTRS